MMKKLVILFAILSLVPSMSKAQPVAKDGIQEVIDIPSIPAKTTAQMPKGSKNKFFGSFSLNYQSQPFFMHLYEVSLTKQELAVAKGYEKMEKNYFLDILLALESGKDSQLQLVNSIFLNHRTFDLMSSDAPKIEVAWLDPEAHQIPLIRLETGENGLHGSLGQVFFFVFPKGWKEKPAIQTFLVGNWGLEEVYDYPVFGDLDKTGLLTMKLYDEKLHWNGEKFVTASGKYVGG